MTLKVPLLFHFNQHLSQFAYVASRVCYRGLLRLLRAHPALPVNIHISGTLIDALKWLDPEPLELIRDGLNAGQFELLGSTYAQNVPYATDDWDNARQIELHQQLLHDTFGVTPTVFWNPERCWRQSLLPVVADAGYQAILIEDHILKKAGVMEPVVATSSADGRRLTAVCDDETFKHRFNFAAWTGRAGQLEAYLDAFAAHPAADRYCLAYAEDAEAMGLWGWSQGVVPNQTWQHLDYLFSLLEARRDVSAVLLSNAPSPSVDITPLPEGSAAWMDASLRRQGAPYHEDGYSDWFDFNARAPRLADYRRLYDSLRRQLAALEPAPTPPAGRLAKQALHTFLAFQYEFGCIGIGAPESWVWNGARASAVLAQAARLAAGRVPNSQGAENHLYDGRNLVVTSPAGGRLLYWFDLASGRQLIGNQLAIPPARYEGEEALPALPARPHPWFPADLSPGLSPPDAVLMREAPPTRLGKFLPDWIWQEEAGAVELLLHPPYDASALVLPLPAQRRGLVDFVTVDGEEEAAGAGAETVRRRAGESIEYRRSLPQKLTLTKSYRLVEGAVAVTYQLANQDERPHTVRLHIVSELCPDYAAVVRHGREALDFIKDTGRPGVANLVTGCAVRLRATCPFAAPPDYQEAFLALEICLYLAVDLSAGASEAFTIFLELESKEG